MSEKLVSAVTSGNRRDALEQLRDELAERFAGSEGKDAATISKELREVMRELEAIPTGREESVSDDLAKRRAARLSKAQDQDGSRTG